MTITQTSQSVSPADVVLADDHNTAVVDIAAIIAALAALKAVPRRQTVLAGPVAPSTGLPSALGYSGGNVSIDASPTPIVLAFANGFAASGALDEVEAIAADVAAAWSGLQSSSTSYLYVDRNPSTGALTYGATVQPPIYAGAASASADGWLSLAMTNYTVPSPYVASASNDGAAGGQAWKAFDGPVDGTQWQTATGNSPPQWLKLDHGVPYMATQYRVGRDVGTGTGLPTAWTLEGSNDDAAWTTLDTASGQSLPGGGYVTRSIGSPAAYRYYRITVTAVNSGTYANISQLEFYGTSAGFHWFDLSTWTMKAWNGTAWEAKQRVFIGQATTDGSSNVTSIVTYAYRGEYDSGWFGVTDNSNTAKAHNLGMVPGLIDLTATTAASVVYRWSPWYNAAYLGGSVGSITATSLTVSAHSLSAIAAADAIATITQARVVASRGW